MDCQQCDSKKLFKVFDASKRKRTRKKREGKDDTQSLATNDSASGCNATLCRACSAKASLQNVKDSDTCEVPVESIITKGDRDSSPSVIHSHEHIVYKSSRSPRSHRKTRDGTSLALKAGMVSTPRSTSPNHNGDGVLEHMPRDQDSFIYAFLEDAVKKEKRQKHSRRHEDRRYAQEERYPKRESEASPTREHRHHHRRKHDDPQTRDKSQKDNISKSLDPTVVFETFAKLCSHLNEKSFNVVNQLPRTQSHKSLQCEVVSKRNIYDSNHPAVKLASNKNSQERITDTPKVRSQEYVARRYEDDYADMHEKQVDRYHDRRGCEYTHDMDYNVKCPPKRDVRSKGENESLRYRDYNIDVVANRSRIAPRDRRDVNDYDRERYYHKKQLHEERSTRNFDNTQERYIDDNRTCIRKVITSDTNRIRENDKRRDDIRDRENYGSRDIRDKLYDDRQNYYEDGGRTNRSRNYENMVQKDTVSRRNLNSHCEKISIASRDEDYKERERYSERDRASALSVDGDASVVSARSTYLRSVKQEIAEQREAMDKMMQLWKELMRCFKGMSQNERQNDKNVQETATNARNSAMEQLRLWRECMRRYETVARDVGDTDARLMEEINKQRSEMSEMASMWQECLQKYRDISKDFNNLKQQLATTESPNARLPATAAEGEGVPLAYRLPPSFPMQPPPLASGGPAYPPMGSPLRSRASAPPAWWWYSNERPPGSPRRRSSPDSRDRDRDRRNRTKERERDHSRHKEKQSKPTVARSDHRHKKR